MGLILDCSVLIAAERKGRNARPSRPGRSADRLIGMTALELGYGVLTGNVRHFERIPGR